MKFVTDISNLVTNEEYVFNGYQAPFGMKCIEVIGRYLGDQSIAGFDCAKIKHEGIILFLRIDALMYCKVAEHPMIKCA